MGALVILKLAYVSIQPEQNGHKDVVKLLLVRESMLTQRTEMVRCRSRGQEKMLVILAGPHGPQRSIDTV